MSQTPWPSYGPVPSINDPRSGARLNMPDSPEGLRQYPGVVWAQTLLDKATPWIPYAPDNSIGLFTRIYAVTLTNGTINQETPLPLRFDTPVIVTDMSAGIMDTTGAALPVGMNPLDNFALRVQNTSNDQYIIIPALGGSVCGTAQFPRKIPGNGWKLARGMTLQLLVTPLRATLRIDIAIMCVEVHAGANFGPNAF